MSEHKIPRDKPKGDGYRRRPGHRVRVYHPEPEKAFKDRMGRIYWTDKNGSVHRKR